MSSRRGDMPQPPQPGPAGTLAPLQMHMGLSERHMSVEGRTRGTRPNAVAPAADQAQGDEGIGRARSESVDSSAEEDETLGWDVVEDQRYIRAAVFIEDALHGRHTDHLSHPQALKVYSIYHASWARALMTFNVLLQLCLAFFERPSPFQHIEWLTNTLEYFCLSLYTLEAISRRYYQGPQLYWRNRWNVAKAVIVLVMLLDETLRVTGATPVRYTRILRPFFLVEKKRVRMVVNSVLMTLPRIMDVVFLGTFFIFIFGVIGFLLFLETPQHEIFSTLGNTYVQLIVLTTTANYPDVMMPAYRTNRIYALYFIIYLVVILYVIMNLIMAVIYTHYRSQQQQQVKRSVELEKEGLAAAFYELDAEKKGVIDFNIWVKLMKALRPSFTPEKVVIMFYLVDYDDSKELDLEEFYRVVKVMKLRIRRTDRSLRSLKKCLSPARSVMAWMYRGSRETVRQFTHSTLFDVIIDGLIVLSGWLSYLETLFDDDSSANWIDPVQFVFSFFFVTEQVVRVYGIGFKRFWRSAWSQFDVVIVASSFIAENVIAIVGSSPHSGILRIILLIRIFRLFRLINGIRRFRVIVGTVFQLLPALWIFFQMLLALYYFFAIIGMEFFGGVIQRGNPALMGTAYDADDYYANTFDSFPIAVVTLFELMVVNNWQVTMDGYAEVCGESSRVYFVAWWLLSVVLILNLIVAFVLEAYFLQWEMNTGRKMMESRLRCDICKAEARASEEGMLETPIDLDLLARVAEDDTYGASGLRWQAEQRKHISDLLRVMHEGDLAAESAAGEGLGTKS